MTPSDPDTLITALIEAERVTSNAGQKIVIFSWAQQLYRVLLNILFATPDMFPNVLPRLGGMHMLMSFVGATAGSSMAESGLKDILHHNPGIFIGVWSDMFRSNTS